MKCNICKEEIEECDGCGNEFHKGDTVLHDSLTEDHYCGGECHPDIEVGEVV